MGTTIFSPYLSGPASNAMFLAAGGFVAPTTAATSLSSAYSYGSTGNAFSWFFRSQETATLTDIYCYVSAVVGSGATGGNINYEVREGLAANYKPGSTLTSSGTIAIGNTTGWKTISGLSISLTAGKFYSITFGDVNGNATNYVTLSVGTNGSGITTNWSVAITTTNGFSSGSNLNKQPYGAWKVGAVWYGGGCFDAMSTVTSGTYERGCSFQVPAPMTLLGICDPQQDTTETHNGEVFSLYAYATATLGTALTSFTVPTFTVNGTSPSTGVMVFPQNNWYDVQPNTQYRLVMKPPSATTIPRKNTSVATVPANVKAACFPLGGNCYWTDASSGSFVDDNNSVCLMGPLFVPSVGGGTPLIGEGMVY
jgi:hypothetical protein